MNDTHQLDRLTGDVHFLTVPFRLFWHMILLSLFVLFTPVIIIVLLLNAYCGVAIRPWLLSIDWFPPIWAYLIGSQLGPESLIVTKPASVFLIPLVMAFWSEIIIGIYEAKRGIRNPGRVRFVLFFLTGLLGAASAGIWFHEANANTYFTMVTIGSFAPVLVWLIANLFRRPARHQ
jgi:hypothetical protein